MHIAFSYLVRAGQKMRKDTKTHQDRTLAINAVTVAVLAERKQHVQAVLADAGVMLAHTAYVFTNNPAGRTPGTLDWVTHKVSEVAHDAGISPASKRCSTTQARRPWRVGTSCATLIRCPRSIGVLPPTSPN